MTKGPDLLIVLLLLLLSGMMAFALIAVPKDLRLVVGAALLVMGGGNFLVRKTVAASTGRTFRQAGRPASAFIEWITEQRIQKLYAIGGIVMSLTGAILLLLRR